MSIFKDGLIRQGASNPTSSVYEIDQSIRFNDNDSAYMYRNVDTTFSNKFTISYWWKKGNSSRQYHVTWRDKRGNGYAYSYVGLFSDQLYFFEYGDHSAHGLVVKAQYQTNRVFRDPSAWYHIVASIDYTDGVSTDQVKLYVNGVRETDLATSTNNTSYAGQSQSTGSPNYLGIGYLYALSQDYTDGYLAEINFVDGYTYGPEYFGEFNSSNIWIPKEYEESYGTNGFYVKGEDSSDLGNDSSGNNKDFTTSGLAANDQVTDSPTNNFAVLNPLSYTYGTLSDGNLDFVGNGSNHDMVVATFSNRTGKWYCEGTFTNTGGDADQLCMFGVVNLDSYTPGTSPTFPGGNAASWGYYPDDGANPGLYNNGSLTDALASAATNDIMGVALDCDAGTCSWYKNNTLLITKTIGSGDWAFIIGHNQGNGNINFGQQGFTYTPPTGYNAVNSRNVGS